MLSIGVLLPDVLGTYGDNGNAVVLKQRARMRGLDAQIVPISLGEPVPDDLDIYTLGGGEDVAQILAAEHLIADGGVTRAAQAGRPILAICAGLQLLGESFRAAGRIVEGVGLLDVRTVSLEKRMIGEVVSIPARDSSHNDAAQSTAQNDPAQGIAARVLARLDQPLTGFANHMGATILGDHAAPLGVLRSGSVGNSDVFALRSLGLDPEEAERVSARSVGMEGVVQGSVLGTYLHGPVLARNPQFADALLSEVLGVDVETLPVDEELLGRDLPAHIQALRRSYLPR